jgi:hypothetical protein
VLALHFGDHHLDHDLQRTKVHGLDRLPDDLPVGPRGAHENRIRRLVGHDLDGALKLRRDAGNVQRDRPLTNGVEIERRNSGLLELLRQHAGVPVVRRLIVRDPAHPRAAAAASAEHGLQRGGELTRANVLQSEHEQPDVARWSARFLIRDSSTCSARSGGGHLNQSTVLLQRESIRLGNAPEQRQNLWAHHGLLHVQRDLAGRKITVDHVETPGLGERGDDEPHIDVLKVDHGAAIGEHRRRVLRLPSRQGKNQQRDRQKKHFSSQAQLTPGFLDTDIYDLSAGRKEYGASLLNTFQGEAGELLPDVHEARARAGLAHCEAAPAGEHDGADQLYLFRRRLGRVGVYGRSRPGKLVTNLGAPPLRMEWVGFNCPIELGNKGWTI